mgnify:CR=1 FL=1
MSFKKNNYKVVRNAISAELANFLYIYFQNKRQAVSVMKQTKYLSPFDKDQGHFKDPGIPNSFSIYGDPAFETVLMGLRNKVEKHTKLKLYETYSYGRIYKKGDVLPRHKDRFSCEISVSLNYGGDPRPLFIEPDKTTGCAQVFLHYNNIKTTLADFNKYDTRPFLCLPEWFKKTQLP